MPGMSSNRDYKRLQVRRNAYAQHLLALGIIKDSNKWRTLMHRKGL